VTRLYVVTDVSPTEALIVGNYTSPPPHTTGYLLEDMDTDGPPSNVVPVDRDPLAGYNRRDRRRLLARARRQLRRHR
jgi:hypothetical protein